MDQIKPGKNFGDHDDDHQVPPAVPSILSSISVRRKRRKNIVHCLFDRQYKFKPTVHPSMMNLKLHQYLVPNFSIENIERPHCYLHKFTNDGRYLFAFSMDLVYVLLYEYRGPMAAAKLLKQVPSDPGYLNYRGTNYSVIRREIFNRFFRLRHTIKVSPGNDQLSRDCSLFTEDNRFIIVVSVTPINETRSSYFDRNRSNESIPLNSSLLFQDFQFHLIDIEAGKVTDVIELKCDKIYLFANHGTYLYKNLLSILSIQHQTIHLYYVKDNGKFIPIRNIGRFCYDDDLQLYETTVENNPLTSKTKRPVPAFRETPYNSLKHRLLTFLYKRSLKESEKCRSMKPVQDFYRDFDLYVSLRMWKMQLLDGDHLLIKYEQESTLMKSEVTSFVKDFNLFVVYNWKTTEIIEIFPQNSQKLLKAYEMFNDYFRRPPAGQIPCSISNNYYAREIFMDHKRFLIEQAGGNENEAIRSILALLPQSAQAITSSPYLDLSLFAYDENVIGNDEKSRYTSEFPIRFYERDTGLLSFCLHTGQVFLPYTNQFQRFPQPAPLVPNRRMIAFIFHPFDPFIISIQPTNHLHHLHIRHFNPNK